MATIFSTKKREANASKLESAFETGVAQANEKSRWKSFIESKPVQSICRGSQAFGRFVAAKTKAAAQWTGTKLKDAGHDFGQGAKAFGHNFAESYRSRQEEKKTNAFVKGCEERGFVVMGKEDFSKAFAALQEMYAVRFPNGQVQGSDPKNVTEAVFDLADTETAAERMSKALIHYSETNGVFEAYAKQKAEADAKNAAEFNEKEWLDDINSLSLDNALGDTSAAKVDAKAADDSEKTASDVTESASAKIKDDIQDSAENGTKSVKFSEQLNLVKESLELRCQYIQNAFQRMAQAENEEQRTQIASDCMQQLRNDLSGISNAIKEQKDAIENPVTEDKGRGNEFDFAEADSTEAQQSLGV